MIGLESHVQLENCKSKLFCPCPTSGPEKPNTRTCPTCLGLPGAKPTLNKEALTEALKVALSLNCKINKSFFHQIKCLNIFLTLKNAFVHVLREE